MSQHPYFLFVSLVLTGFAIDTTGQTSADTFNNFQSITEGTSMFRSYDNRYKGVKGGVTLLERFVPARIVMAKGMKVRHDKVNFDSYSGELLILKNGVEAVVNLSMVSYFVLEPPDADTIRFERMNGIDGKVAFFHRVYSGNVIAYYKKHTKKLIEPSYTGAYSAGRDYSELVAEQQNYFFENGELKEFRNKKNFLQQLSNRHDEAAAFIKREKIDFKNEGDLRRLFYFLNDEDALN